MIAFTDAYRAGLFKTPHLVKNIIAGVVVGLVALPLAMAFAIASGAKPEQGLYTAIVAGLVVSLFGGSRVQIAGPTGAFIVILAGITATHGIIGLQIATMMAGVILVAMGWARLGGVIKFIPDPVITGFTAGIAVIIFVSQWKDFFGLPKVTGDHFHEKFWHLLQALPQLDPATTMIGFLSLAVVLMTPRFIKHVPGPLAALIIATLLQTMIGFEHVATIGSAFGGIPSSLPVPQIPPMSISTIVTLVGPAFAIAMLGAIESLLCAVVADGMAGTRHDANQELVGQGFANILAPIFGGFAATGAIARTATNIRNGGTSPLSGIVHVLVLVLVIVVAAPLAAHIPLCTLAAILFVISWNMSDMHHVIHLIKCAPRSDITVLIVTLALTIFVDLVVAVNVGVVLASLLFMRRMATLAGVKIASPEHVARELGTDLPHDVMVYDFDGPLFFGAVENFERAMTGISDDPRIMVLRLNDVPVIDITGLQTLEENIKRFQGRGIRVILVGVRDNVMAKIQRSGLMDALGGGNVFTSLRDVGF
jgi:sulfate permease, SulP family